MTEGEKMVWAAAFALALRGRLPACAWQAPGADNIEAARIEADRAVLALRDAERVPMVKEMLS